MRTIENLDANIPAEADEDHERESIEWVFGLTGGELEDKPWEPWEPSAMLPEPWDFEYASEGSKRTTFRYWFDGLPDYLGRRDFPDQYAHGVTYRTVVDCELYGEAPAVVYEGGVAWHKVATYRSSGECECPGQHEEDTEGKVTADQRLTPRTVTGTTAGRQRCVLCEEEVGEEHGYIYIGDGWAEIVYRSVDLPEPLGEGFTVGTVVWSKHRLDDDWPHGIIAAGPAPEDFEGMLIILSNTDDDDDEPPYIEADRYEEVKKST